MVSSTPTTERVMSAPDDRFGASSAERASVCIDWLRRYAGTRINSRLMDERRSIAPHILLDFGNQGLLGMQVPVELGGKLELSLSDSFSIMRQLGGINLTLALFVGFSNVLGIRPILRFGKPELQRRLIPDLASGRMLAAFALTEPGAGSNPLFISTTARASGDDEFVLTGTKIWSGSAVVSGVVNVFANQHSSDGKALGHVAFSVPTDLPGVRQGPEALTMGMRGMVQNTIFFEDARIDAKYMLGEPNAGLSVASDAMAQGRLWIAAACVGGMWRALQLALRYARRRMVGNSPLIQSDVTRARIASMHAAVISADAVVSTLARDIDDGVTVPPEAYAAVKVIASEWLWEVVDSAMQTLGGRGYIETNHLPQLMRDARVTRIFEGPTDTLRMYIGKRVFEPTSPLFDYFDQNAAGLGATLRERLNVLRKKAEASGGGLSNLCLETAGELAELYLAKVCRLRSGQRASDDQSIGWLERRIARLEGESVFSASRLPSDLAAQCTVSIGDIEQTAADEDRSMDVYLSRETP